MMVFQSPVRRLFTDAHFGGFFGQELKAPGFDGPLITGQAPGPVYSENTQTSLGLRTPQLVGGVFVCGGVP